MGSFVTSRYATAWVHAIDSFSPLMGNDQVVERLARRSGCNSMDDDAAMAMEIQRIGQYRAWGVDDDAASRMAKPGSSVVVLVVGKKMSNSELEMVTWTPARQCPHTGAEQSRQLSTSE
jgi:hypothetical protein